MPQPHPAEIRNVQTIYDIKHTNGHTLFEATLQVRTTSGKYRNISVSCQEPIENWDDFNEDLIEHVVEKYSTTPLTNKPADQ